MAISLLCRKKRKEKERRRPPPLRKAFQRGSNYATYTSHGQMARLAMQTQEDLDSVISGEGVSRPRTRELSTTGEEIKADLCPVGITISSETQRTHVGTITRRGHT